MIRTQDLQTLSGRPAAETQTRTATEQLPARGYEGEADPAEGGRPASPDLRSWKSLIPHPLLAHIPERERDDPEFQRLLVDVIERGIHTPVLIDSADRILCGRHRVRAAKIAGRDVPVRVVPDDQAAEIILSELCLQRHLPKGALAYLSVPLLEPALEQARERRLAILKSGGKSMSHSVGYAQTLNAEGIAASVGIGRELLRMAVKLRELLAELDRKDRLMIEGQVLSGELGLGYAITAATNIRRNKDQPSRLDKRQEHARLFVTGFKRTLLHWNQASEAQRAEISRELRSMSAEVTPDLRAELRRVFA